MKKTFQLLFLCLFTLSIFSCGDDDDDNNDVSALEGTWTAISSDFDIATTTAGSGTDISSQTVGTTTTVDYELVFTGSNFTTNGSYTYDIAVTVDGTVVNSGLNPFTDVSGAGSFTTNGSQITISESFYQVESNGQILVTGPQTATFSVDGDTLTFSQNEVIISTQGGITTTSTVISTSVWERQ